MASVFDFISYREFLIAALPVSGASRGMRNRLADELNCQKGFISQVLSGRNHFSLEHGIKISHFLNLDASEEEYFILLLHRERAGSKDLEKFYDKKIEEIVQRRKQISERIKSSVSISEADQMTYYSSWLYIAVHICLMIPELRTKAEISNYLGVNQKMVSKVLNFLTQVGYAVNNENHYFAGSVRSHLPASSPLISKHHTNWRVKSIESLDGIKVNDLHYSFIMSISEEAADKIRDILLNAIQNIEPVMKAAQDKTIYVLNLDLFNLSK